MLILVDIDGSLADWKPRDKAAGGSPGRKDMVKYQAYIERLMDDAAIINDQPIPGMLETVRALSNRDGIEIVYLTGRSEKHRTVTNRWLMLHRFPEAELIMRGNTDWSNAVQYKMRHVLKFKEKFSTILAIEDEPEVAQAMSHAGVTVLQVVYGDALTPKLRVVK